MPNGNGNLPKWRIKRISSHKQKRVNQYQKGYTFFLCKKINQTNFSKVWNFGKVIKKKEN